MIRFLLSIISLFNLCDWMIAFLIAGSAAKVRVDPPRDKRRTLLAVVMALFFTGMGIWRLIEFANILWFWDYLEGAIKQAPIMYTVDVTITGALRLLSLALFYFGITIYRDERKGITSGNVIRNWLIGQLEKLR